MSDREPGGDWFVNRARAEVACCAVEVGVGPTNHGVAAGVVG